MASVGVTHHKIWKPSYIDITRTFNKILQKVRILLRLWEDPCRVNKCIYRNTILAGRIAKNNLFYKFAKTNIRICLLGRSHQAGLIQKLWGVPSEVYYSKLNKILTECSWGDPGRLNYMTKTLGRSQRSTLH